MGPRIQTKESVNSMTDRSDSIEKLQNHACLIVQGPDFAEAVATVATVVGKYAARVLTFEQHTEPGEPQELYQRIEFIVDALNEVFDDIEIELKQRLEPLGLTWQLINRARPKRMVVLASKSDHCLNELLWRQNRGELPVSIPMVISNHRDVQHSVEQFDIPFHHVHSQGPDKSAAEAEILKLIGSKADFVVLARYMQILSEDFLEHIDVPIINIHHSFLPAFIGAAPYRKAKERGVKMIGATAHYVTTDLDEGPIIEQDIARVGHAHTAEGMQQRGQYVERAVLSRAVQWHAEDRVIRQGNHTIVFA